MIHIAAPYVTTKFKKSRLSSQVNIGNKIHEIYYEVDSIYTDYLSTENADPFVIGLLHLALEKGEDIVSEAPISEKLHHQLTNYLIPSLVKYKYKETINITTKSRPGEENVFKGIAVGTGLSSGIDSFHTIMTHINLEIPKYNITHLTFLNVGSNGKGEKAEKLYHKRLANAKKTSEKLGLKFLSINSNIGDILNMDFIKTHTFRSFSAVLALQKLFGVYYYASGYPLNEFKISKDATSANFDLLNVYTLSNDHIDFYTSGIELSRLDKVKRVAEFEPSYTRLNVCTNQFNNCGNCEKCIRTQLELYALNKLYLYKNVFDLKQFNSKLNSHLGFMIANQNKSQYKEIKVKLKENDFRLSPIVYIYAIRYKLMYLTKIY